MFELFQSLLNLVVATWDVLVTLVALVFPWTPLLFWVAYWLCGTNWVRLRESLKKGGWIGLLLTGLMAIMVWSVVAPPADGVHYILGLHLSNFVGKTVYVTFLICIMLLCGSVQLAGLCEPWCKFEEDEPAEAHAASHGHH
mgnify:FL=1